MSAAGRSMTASKSIEWNLKYHHDENMANLTEQIRSVKINYITVQDDEKNCISRSPRYGQIYLKINIEAYMGEPLVPCFFY